MKYCSRFLVTITLVPFFLFFIGSSCSDSPSGPSDNPNQLEWQNLGSKTFNESGGEALYENFQIIIPAGTFSKSIKLDFKKSSSKWVYSSESLTELYSVNFDNIPESELKFSIKLISKENLNDVDGVQLFVAFEVTDPMSGKKDYNFLPMEEFQISGNTITADIHVKLTDSYKTKIRQDEIQANPLLLLPPALIFGAAKLYYNKTSSAGNFKVYGHYNLSEPPDELLNALEYVYSELQKIGFDMNRWRNTKNWPWWPFRCYIYPSNTWIIGMSDNEYAFFRPNYISRNLDYMAINAKYIKSSNTLKINLGHEFFHAIQSCYNHEENTIYRWLMEASSAWFETIVSERSEFHIPVTVINSPHFYKNGLNGVTASDKAFHGYPYFYFLKHLTNKFGNRFMFELWSEVDNQPEGRYNPARALMNTVYLKYGQNFYEAYRQFIVDFVKGKIQHDQRGLNDLVTLKEWNVTKDDITNNKEFKHRVDMPDFSAQIFAINFNQNLKELDTDMPFYISFDGSDKMVTAYFLNEDPDRTDVGEINEQNSELKIEDVRDYAGKTIIAIIVNCNYNDEFNGKKSVTISNSVNPLDGRFNWSITEENDACNSIDYHSLIIRQKANLKNNTITLYNEEEDEEVTLNLYMNGQNFTMKTDYEDGYGTTIEGKIINNDKWEATVTIHDYNLDKDGNKIPCTSTGKLIATRLK